MINKIDSFILFYILQREMMVWHSGASTDKVLFNVFIGFYFFIVERDEPEAYVEKPV